MQFSDKDRDEEVSVVMAKAVIKAALVIAALAALGALAWYLV